MKPSRNQQQAVCKKEATNLINCVRISPYNHSHCISLLNALRQCVINKKRVKVLSANRQSGTKPTCRVLPDDP